MIPRTKREGQATEVLVWSPYYPPSMGGLQSHAQEFNRHLASRGYTITVFTPRLPPQAAEREQESFKVTVIRYPAFELIPNWPLPRIWQRRFWTLLAPLYRRPAQLIVARTRFFATTWLAVLFARLTGRPYLHIEHGADYVQFRHSLMRHVGRMIDHTLGRVVIHSAAAVVANSHHTAAFIAKLAPQVPVTVIYRGIEAETLKKVQPASRPLAGQARVRIGYFGRLIAGKGVTDLLRSVALLAHHPIEVLIVGDGPDARHLVELVKKLNLTNTVVFSTDTAWTHAMALLKDCDIIVNPSYTEGLPTIVIEAALCRKAIVATDVGGTAEIIRHRQSGLLVPPRDAQELTAALEELIVAPAWRRELGERAYQHVAGKFEWPAAIEKYHHLITKVLA